MLPPGAAAPTPPQTPPPPDPMMALQAQLQALQSQPTWEDVKSILGDDGPRLFRIDIETDSTIASDVAQEQAGISQVLRGVAQFMTAFGPAVQMGLMPMEAAKAMLLSAVRRAKFGKAVEDSIESIPEGPAAPQQAPPDPKDGDAQTDLARQEMIEATRQRQIDAEAEAKKRELDIKDAAEGAKADAEKRRLDLEERKHDLAERQFAASEDARKSDNMKQALDVIPHLEAAQSAAAASDAVTQSQQHLQAIADTIPALHQLAQHVVAASQQHAEAARAHAESAAGVMGQVHAAMERMEALHAEAQRPKEIVFERDKKTGRVAKARVAPRLDS